MLYTTSNENILEWLLPGEGELCGYYLQATAGPFLTKLLLNKNYFLRSRSYQQQKTRNFMPLSTTLALR